MAIELLHLSYFGMAYPFKKIISLLILMFNKIQEVLKPNPWKNCIVGVIFLSKFYDHKESNWFNQEYSKPIKYEEYNFWKGNKFLNHAQALCINK